MIYKTIRLISLTFNENALCKFSNNLQNAIHEELLK